jgi:hypothetical protein
MDSVKKISLHSRLWIPAVAAAALSIGTWSIAPAPANAGVFIGVGIPFPGIYAQYPYYPYPPSYYPYYPPPSWAYSPAPSYTPQPSYPPQAGRSGGNIARQLNQQELNRLQAAPVYPPRFHIIHRRRAIERRKRLRRCPLEPKQLTRLFPEL